MFRGCSSGMRSGGLEFLVTHFLGLIMGLGGKSMANFRKDLD
jgi:hypothetical protein